VKPGLAIAPVLLLSTSILLSACAQLFMKAGMIELAAETAAGTNLPATLFATGPALAWVVAGLACYGVSMLAWLWLLAGRALSLVYPLLSISYILVYAGAVAWPRIGEHATVLRSAGTLLIVAGVVLVTWSGRPARSSD